CGRLPSAVHLSILRPPLVLSLLLFFARSAHPRHLHSFPTRRSSDLIFSLMSGLYGGMNPRMFCTRPDVVIPGLGSRLGASFDSFLVTPGRVQSYFPMAFMSRSVVSEIVDDLELPDSERESAAGGRHELDGVDYFVQRIETAKEPFLGI